MNACIFFLAIIAFGFLYDKIENLKKKVKKKKKNNKRKEKNNDGRSYKTL